MMDNSLDESIDSSISNILIDSSKDQTKNGDVSTVSPLSKSRYGRTHKPKISEDFYNIDVILELTRETKKNSKCAQPAKSIKLNKSKDDLNSPLKSTKTVVKALKFEHVTGDPILTESPSFPLNDTPSTAIHNFFNDESGMSVLYSTFDINSENEINTEIKQNDLQDNSLNLESVDVTKVLKIISTKSPDSLQNNLDLKSNIKPVLKTYTNKRKNFNKTDVVESFGLPDKPIFPIENEKPVKLNEPKRIKNLDVAPTSSENDINIVDKNLLNTPWKIGKTDLLLDTCQDEFDVSNNFKDIYGSFSYDIITPLRSDLPVVQNCNNLKSTNTPVTCSMIDTKREIKLKVTSTFNNSKIETAKEDETTSSTSSTNRKKKNDNEDASTNLKTQFNSGSVKKLKILSLKKSTPNVNQNAQNYNKSKILGSTLQTNHITNTSKKQKRLNDFKPIKLSKLQESAIITELFTPKVVEIPKENSNACNSVLETSSVQDQQSELEQDPKVKDETDEKIISSSKKLSGTESPTRKRKRSLSPSKPINNERTEDLKPTRLSRQRTRTATKGRSKSVAVNANLEEKLIFNDDSMIEYDCLNQYIRKSQRTKKLKKDEKVELNVAAQTKLDENITEQSDTNIETDSKNIEGEVSIKIEKDVEDCADTKSLLDTSIIKNELEDIQLGDILWARIGGHPYWPCLVVADPDSFEHIQIVGMKKGFRVLYHVRFFGDKGRRSWINSSCTIPYTDKNDLTKIIKQEIKTKSTVLLQACVIRPGCLARWKHAVTEAESVKSKTVEERFQFFINMFSPKVKNKKRLSLIDKNIKELDNIIKSRSKSLPPNFDHDFKVKKEETDDKTLINVDILDSTSVDKKQLKNNSKIIKPKEKPSKIEARQISNDSTTSESSEIFSKNSWQTISVSDTHKVQLNEINSEYSDTDSISKSSTNTSIHSSYKDQNIRHKRNNLFKGVSRDRVCQICKNRTFVLKCTGPCSGRFHLKCADYRFQSEVKIEQQSEQNINSKLDDKIEDVVENCSIQKDGNVNNSKSDLDQISFSSSKGDVGVVDSDKSNLEHILSPKISALDYNKLSLSEKIDLKMKEIMRKNEKKTKYPDFTIDYTSSEESSANISTETEENNISSQEEQELKSEEIDVNILFQERELKSEKIDVNISSQELKSEENVINISFQEQKQKPEESIINISSLEQKLKIIQKGKIKVKHVTADVSFGSGESSEELQETVIINSCNSNKEFLEPIPLKNSIKEEPLHITGDCAPEHETSIDLNLYKDFKCSYCITNFEPPCFVCNKEISNKNASLRQKCSLPKCGKFYHADCLKMWPQTQWSIISSAKNKNSNKNIDSFVCPVHVCHTCSSDDPHAAVSRCSSDKVVKCLHCPATYHTTNFCVPAGTLILSTSQIVCPRHLGQPVISKGRTKPSRTINTPWCFICSKGGDLICCETCPTSVHTDCLTINLLEDGTFICEDCETGRFPLYDEIVWVKLGSYRWWPAVILFPNEVPENIKNIPHNKGEFVVKFFGTHDHYWVSRGRVFLFQEGDKGHYSPSKKRVDSLFKKSIEEATAAHHAKKVFKSNREAEVRTCMKPPPYIRVKVNKPVGNVRLFDGNVSNTTSCDCDPNQKNPCGPDSDCLNRLLLTECDPNVCPAKDKCNNQRFEKREYPPLVPYKTQARGWGLKSLTPISKGQFVIEYVGEIIDDQEYQRRIHKMHEQKDENYYFLIIDKDRIIDAGPKGNLARFMNHCCQPNCETQKWTVNGDTRVGLFAVRDIPADSELTFNYNLECIGKEKKICKCGASNCSGFIGVKAKTEESQKKQKKNNQVKKKKPVTPEISKNDGPCFICNENGDVVTCNNKICTKFYHLRCINLEALPEGKWVCPWHKCNECTKRTIRCCVKCINSYCPLHSEGCVRYDKLLGFVCYEHDPIKESQILTDETTTVTKSKSTVISVTKETDVTSTTSDEIDQNSQIMTETPIADVNVEDKQVLLTEPVTSTPIKNDMSEMNMQLEKTIPKEIPKMSIPNKQKSVASLKNKRISEKQKKSLRNSAKKPKLSNQNTEKSPLKLKPSLNTTKLLNLSLQNEVKLLRSVPVRHLRITRNNTSLENKRYYRQQNELEKDLPIRKRSRPRCEATL